MPIVIARREAHAGERQADDGGDRRSDEPGEPVEQRRCRGGRRCGPCWGPARRRAPRASTTAATTGAAAKNSPACRVGNGDRGISDRSAPGLRGSSRREARTVMRPSDCERDERDEDDRVRRRVSWMASPASSDPSASPPVRPTLARIVPSRFRPAGANSTSAAVNAAVAAPLAIPWTIRPAMTQPTSGARRNRRFEPSWTTRRAISTGRRPMWSDSDPRVRAATRNPTA